MVLGSLPAAVVEHWRQLSLWLTVHMAPPSLPPALTEGKAAVTVWCGSDDDDGKYDDNVVDGTTAVCQ